MAVVHYEMRNRDNMQSLLDYIRGGSAAHNSIEYLQAGKVVLLGKGHDPIDVQRVKDATGSGTYSGKLKLYTNKIKKVFQPTEHKLVVYIFPDDGRKGAMAELESAIQEATVGTFVEGWPIEYQWE